MLFVAGPYIKKEDIHDFINAQRRNASFVLLGTVVILMVLQILVEPKIAELFTDLKYSIPWHVKFSPYITTAVATLIAVYAIFLLLNKPDKTKIATILSKYKDGEMIKVGDVSDRKMVWFPLIIILLEICYLSQILIAPIYTLSSHF